MEIAKLETTRYEAILKYGWWGDVKRMKHEDCITGLICMKAKYIKQIETPIDDAVWIEWKWARVTLDIPDNYICALDTLGIMIAPKVHEYFEV